MSRSHHITIKQLKKERIVDAFLGLPRQELSELEKADIKKRVSKTNSKWKRKAKIVDLKPGCISFNEIL